MKYTCILFCISFVLASSDVCAKNNTFINADIDLPKDMNASKRIVNRCRKITKDVRRNSFNRCLRNGRLTTNECYLWAILDENDDYYKCIVK